MVQNCLNVQQNKTKMSEEHSDNKDQKIHFIWNMSPVYTKKIQIILLGAQLPVFFVLLIKINDLNTNYFAWSQL